MKILHAANFSPFKYGRSFYSIDRKISWGCSRLGQFVCEFSYRDIARHESPFGGEFGGVKRMHRRLLETLDQLQPEVLLLGHTELIDGECLAAVRRDFPSLAIGMWYVDLITPSKKQQIASKMPYLDAFFVTSAGEALTQFQDIAAGVLSYLPNLCAASVETGRAYQANCEYDFCFIGTPTPDRVELREKLKKALPDLRFAFHGSSEDRLEGADYLHTIGHSAMGLNYSRDNSVPLYSSDRIAQLMASGVLTFSPAIPELDKLIPEDCIVIYRNDEELIDRIRYFHAHPEQRQKIAERGCALTHQRFGAERICAWMLNTIRQRTIDDSVEWASFSWQKSHG